MVDHCQRQLENSFLSNNCLREKGGYLSFPFLCLTILDTHRYFIFILILPLHTVDKLVVADVKKEQHLSALEQVFDPCQ